MGLRHNPITYLVLSNALFWGIPLTVIHLLPDHGSVGSEPGLDRLHQAGPMASQAHLPTPGPATPRPATPGLPHGDLDFGSVQDPLTAADPGTAPAADAARSTAAAHGETTATLPAWPKRPNLPPDLLSQLRGADGLGGVITLESRDEPRMPMAARAERLQWARSNDQLAPLPQHWREPLRQELAEGVRVSRARTVNLPVPGLAERQEVPVIISDQGVAEGLVEPSQSATRDAIEAWAARQQPPEAGTVEVLVVAAEPMNIASRAVASGQDPDPDQP